MTDKGTVTLFCREYSHMAEEYHSYLKGFEHLCRGYQFNFKALVYVYTSAYVYSLFSVSKNSGYTISTACVFLIVVSPSAASPATESAMA